MTENHSCTSEFKFQNLCIVYIKLQVTFFTASFNKLQPSKLKEVCVCASITSSLAIISLSFICFYAPSFRSARESRYVFIYVHIVVEILHGVILTCYSIVKIVI